MYMEEYEKAMKLNVVRPVTVTGVTRTSMGTFLVDTDCLLGGTAARWEARAVISGEIFFCLLETRRTKRTKQAEKTKNGGKQTVREPMNWRTVRARGKRFVESARPREVPLRSDVYNARKSRFFRLLRRFACTRRVSSSLENRSTIPRQPAEINQKTITVRVQALLF